MNHDADSIIQAWMRQTGPRRTPLGSVVRRGKLYCFAEGTTVKTAGGEFPIELIEPGQKVLTFDWESGRVDEAPVETLEAHTVTAPMLDLRADNDVVSVTAGHRFATGDFWVPVEELESASRCGTLEGRSTTVRQGDSVRVSRGTVYNLIVEGSDNYFVGEAGLQVCSQ